MSGAPEIYPACVARKVPRNEWNSDKAKGSLGEGMEPIPIHALA